MVNKILDWFKRKIYSCEAYARARGVKIGKGCSIATRMFGSEPYLVEIGDNVQITNDVRFFTHGGGWVFRHKDPEFDSFGKIKIHDNVYIGNGTMILPGVIIGNNVVIGAGSIVTKSIPDNVVVAGNPARIVCTIDDFFVKANRYNVKTKQMGPNEKRAYLLSLEDEHFMRKDFLLFKK